MHLRIDPAEAHRGLQRLLEADRGDPASFLGELHPEPFPIHAGRVKPRLKRFLEFETDDGPSVRRVDFSVCGGHVVCVSARTAPTTRYSGMPATSGLSIAHCSSGAGSRTASRRRPWEVSAFR